MTYAKKPHKWIVVQQSSKRLLLCRSNHQLWLEISAIAKTFSMKLWIVDVKF
jgi:hypothetical protein